LVKVRAAPKPVNWHFVEGSPKIMRAGVTCANRDTRLGVDFAGTVEAIGKNVLSSNRATKSSAGRWRLRRIRLPRATEPSLKPANITFEQAPPTSPASPRTRIRDKGKVEPGQVLINGASGGVGTFAVQIAKVVGADVTGVCGETRIWFDHSVRIRHRLREEDFTKSDQRYDVIS
jgi:NADPH:quinone reductase-like Zn-dependent oxidoreductase